MNKEKLIEKLIEIIKSEEIGYAFNEENAEEVNKVRGAEA